MASRVQITGLTKGFRRHDGRWMPVLNGISLDVQGLVCVLGPSGCGKSTLLNILAGVETADSGQIRVAAGSHQGRTPVVGYVFQDPRLLDWKTVRENLLFALRGMGVPRALWEQRVQRYLELVGLSEFRDQYPPYLSGGMRQRVGLARALAVEPDILLMDEPFSRLDEITARRLRQELLEIQERLDQTVLFVTHNAQEAAWLGDVIYVLSARPARVVGRIENPVPRPRRWDDPRLREVEVEILRRLEEGGALEPEAGPQPEPSGRAWWLAVPGGEDMADGGRERAEEPA